MGDTMRNTTKKLALVLLAVVLAITTCLSVPAQTALASSGAATTGSTTDSLASESSDLTTAYASTVDYEEAYAEGVAGFWEYIGNEEVAELIRTISTGSLGNNAASVAETDYTVTTAAGNLENFAVVLDMLDYFNDYRQSVGLSELPVSAYLMAVSVASADWADDYYGVSYTHQIASDLNVGENLAWNSSTWQRAYEQWLDNEKAYFDAAVEALYGVTGLEGADAYSYYQSNKSAIDSWVTRYSLSSASVGHYINIINPNYKYTGAGYATKDSANSGSAANWNVYEQSFSSLSSSNVVKYGTYTVSQLRELYEEYLDYIGYYQPELSLAVAYSGVDISNAKAGDTVTYTITVKNVGNTSLSNVVVSSSLLGGTIQTVSELESGDSTTVSGTYTLTQADIDSGAISNYVSVTSTYKSRTVTAEGTLNLDLASNPSISLSTVSSVKVIDDPEVGTNISFVYTITNTGNTTLSNIALTDAMLGGNVALEDTTLAPGASTTATVEYSITQADIDNGSVVSSATVMAYDPKSSMVSSTAVASVATQRDPVPVTAELAGSDRYETMAAIVSAGFDSSDVVILATGEKFPDALAASGLAGYLNAPIVLTGSDSTQAIETISSLGAKQIYVLGDEYSISDKVLEDIISATGATATRIAGTSRQETALAITEKMVELGANPTVAIITYSEKYADALSISSYAYATAASIFLTESDGSISDEVIKAIENGNYETILILGDENAVSLDVDKRFTNAERLEGDTRYETSVAIAEYTVSTGVLSYDTVTFATGENFPDALAGGPFCGVNNSVLLLVNENAQSAFNLIAENASSINNVYFLGNENAVSATVRATIVEAATG